MHSQSPMLSPAQFHLATALRPIIICILPSASTPTTFLPSLFLTVPHSSLPARPVIPDEPPPLLYYPDNALKPMQMMPI
ncbi:hypothetical protein CALCODRAFT_49866 [Calocera cornea HHB12733]|uniref:Uncharacterized protein n=1 Tax=Calocera cornea HHB12733 TaxID=1353952 RepID=A0A165DTP7_9BASI|nr:hypothetical protein CALCODRAFT_49866 [Calocera cornea HHB12733]